MKTKMIKPLLAIICLLSSINASAYDFEVDDIYYDVVSLGDLTCKVARVENNNCKGDFVIPAHVNYSNRTLTVVGIAENAFRSCREMTGITIPNTITFVYNAFVFCSKLERVKFEDGETKLTVSNESFWGCPIKSLYIGRNLSYSYSPFSNNENIENLTIGNSVTEIGNSAFSGCSGLTSVTIPNSVTKIGFSAFSYCRGLTSVTIPNSVTEIGEYAFYECSGLTELYMYGITPPKAFDCGFSNNQYMTLNVYVPQEALEAYQNADVWKNFWNLQGFDATGIKDIEIDGKDTKDGCYDLRGNRLDAPKRGVNIINGRKVMVK